MYPSFALLSYVFLFHHGHDWIALSPDNNLFWQHGFSPIQIARGEAHHIEKKCPEVILLITDYVNKREADKEKEAKNNPNSAEKNPNSTEEDISARKKDDDFKKEDLIKEDTKDDDFEKPEDSKGYSNGQSSGSNGQSSGSEIEMNALNLRKNKTENHESKD